MSVDLTRIVPGGARDPDEVNALLTTLDAESGALGTDNLRPFGLDRANLAAGLHRSIPSGWNVSAAGPTAFTNTTYATPTVGGTQLRTTNQLVVGTEERLRVRAHLYFPTDPAGGPAWGVPQGRYVQALLQYQLNGGGPTAFTDSRRHLGHLTTLDVAAGTVALWMYLGPGTYDWVEVQTRLQGGAGTYRMANCALVGEHFKRVS